MAMEPTARSAMRDADKSKEQLIRELEEMRSGISELESSKKECERTAEALRKSEESFRKIFNHSNDAILVVDPDQDKIIDVNFKACEMLGFTSEKLLSMPVSAIHPDEMPMFRVFAKSVSDNGSGWTNELSCLTRLGKKLASEISASLIDMSGRTYMVALVRDISKRKEAEEKLRQANERMKTDLEAAAQIQRSLLPHRPLSGEGVQFAWEFQPCDELAGHSQYFSAGSGSLGFLYP